jgi:hypothetical protein
MGAPVNAWCRDPEPHPPHGDFRPCAGIVSVPFDWFRPVTSSIVMRPKHGSPLVGSRYDGLWVHRPAGARRIVIETPAGRAELVPSGQYEQRGSDGMVAEVWWEYPPIEPGHGRTLLLASTPEALDGLKDRWRP